MEIGKYPETFPARHTIFKKTFKKYWIQLVAALACFISSGANIANTIIFFSRGDTLQGVRSLILVGISLLLACANGCLFIRGYRNIKKSS